MARWTDEEIATLKARVAQRVRDAEIARELGRSVSAVMQQRLSRGIRRYRPAARRPGAMRRGPAGRRTWTAEEDRVLLDWPTRYGEMRACARHLGRSLRACQGRKRLLLGSCQRPLPPLAELEDAIARWGIAGAAEEYEVSRATIRRWRKALAGGK